jgi:hypothetical protein
LVRDRSLPVYLYVFGSLNLARGIANLALSPDPSEPAFQFAHLPESTLAELKAKLRFGTGALETLASDSRRARIADGAFNLGAGLAAVPLLFMRDDFAIDSALDYFVVAGAGVSVLVGAVTLLTRTEAEKRWAAYQRFRGRLKRRWIEERRRAAARRSPEVRLAVEPAAGGAFLWLSGNF